MIEQPQTAILERTTHLVDDSPDAPLDKQEKEHLIDEEVILVKQDPITGSIRKTIRHLHTVGGFTARWRGLGISMVYHLAHSLISNFIFSFVHPFAWVQVLAYVASSVLLARIHMTWTHVIISKPSSKPWFRRVAGDRKTWRTLVLPSAVYATAQMATIGLPFLAFVIFTSGPADAQQQCIGVMVGGLIMLALSVLILLPASVTLTRIEASFLPADEDTIVPFDRTLNGATTNAITLDGSPSGSRKSLFIEAWRSFDMASRLRLIKFYIKMALVQSTIVLVGLHVILAEVYMLGLDRLSIVAQAVSAQLQLAAMGVTQD